MALSRRKNVNFGGSLPHLSLTLFNQSVKVRFSKIFLLSHNFFVASCKIGVSKNSKFEFLETKSTIKGGLQSSFNHRKNGQRDPKRARKSKNQSRATKKKRAKNCSTLQVFFRV
ncbi:hypothetical protein MTR67_051939 [Solanum verrucosum]|uniref:Uncharacterized protein n=1 Tax=Solanum verrucosum TaxID=315347 RepID=A0AAF0V748_SOLVR|nr:hypothetical protein MTR67_051939 [Solanum verrucosum]